MTEEMAHFDKNEALHLVDMSIGRNTIGRKWVFNKNLNAKLKVEK